MRKTGIRWVAVGDLSHIHAANNGYSAGPPM